jgi:hypothetical protein
VKSMRKERTKKNRQQEKGCVIALVVMRLARLLPHFNKEHEKHSILSPFTSSRENRREGAKKIRRLRLAPVPGTAHRK